MNRYLSMTPRMNLPSLLRFGVIVSVTCCPSRSTTTAAGAPFPAASSSWTTDSAVMSLPLMVLRMSPAWIFPAEAESSESPAAWSCWPYGMSSSLSAEATAFSCDVVMATALCSSASCLVVPVG
ncbi:hypothetical protein G205_10243 [Arthrobacter nitrophenolicus]|uniref:Uncharacterized protein n=1 Tax=Arthrobacter nitrophenolicus TaxID=683150 RepID=L8TMU3_9MICC|nr:hypothetical protein G205_10243 [Arthrobacter nitrophenolicus]